MKIIVKEDRLQIKEDSPFEADKFESHFLSNTLLMLIEKTETPFVYALTAPWGSGKTTFIEMCSADFKNCGYSTFIINVWANDHLLETREIFFNHLSEILRNIDDLKSTAVNSKKFIKEKKEALTAIGSLILKLYMRNADVEIGSFLKDIGINVKDTKDSGLDVIQGVQDILKSKQSRISIFQEIRRNLQLIVDYHIEQKPEGHRTKPIIIFIDELDRCMPTKVIQFLDNLKHVFDLKNVIFILSIDKEQLTHSVQSVFGEKFSVHSYLDRFINSYFQIDYTKYFNQYFDELMRRYHRSNYIDEKLSFQQHRALWGFANHISDYVVGFKLTIRDLTWMANFTMEYITTWPQLLIYHLDYIMFVSLFKKKYPIEYREYFTEYFEVKQLDSIIERMVDRITYFNSYYFMDYILPRYLLHRLIKPEIIEDFGNQVMDGRFDYSDITNKIKLNGFGEHTIDRTSFFRVVNEYLKH